MSNLAATTPQTDSVWHRYRDNFARHTLGVTRHLQAQTMRTLRDECGHRGLRLNFEPYISMSGAGGARLSDIADTLGISRQAANQSANQIQAAGYIRRVSDPTDGRAKLVVLTDRGQALRKDGIRMVGNYCRNLAVIAGRPELQQTLRALRRLCTSLDLLPYALPAKSRQDVALLGALLPRISDHISMRLMHLTAARGHPQLRLSFGQLLLYIGPGGGRISQIAAINGVSKQAISTIASELEDLGYIRGEQDPADARQRVLRFTDCGHELIADSVASIDKLNAELAAALTDKSLTTMQNTMANIYHALHIEEDIFGGQYSRDIHALAEQLQQQLGTEVARNLGTLLLTANDRRPA